MYFQAYLPAKHPAIILPVVSYWCENWHLTLRTEHRLKVDYILITNLMHWLLFIHKVLFSSTCFELQVLIFRKMYTCSIWYCHSLCEFLVAYRYTARVRTGGGRLLVGVLRLELCTYKPPGTLIESDSTICCRCTTVSSWRWALEARNM